MQEKEIRLLFKAGVFESAQCAPISMTRGWTLRFLTRDGETVQLELQRSKKEREFKSLDGAAAVAKRIGFDWLQVRLGELEWREKVG